MSLPKNLPVSAQAPPPTDEKIAEEAEVERINSLILRRASDTARWSAPDSVNRSWGNRMRTAVGLLRPEIGRGSTVLDIGCGNMALRDVLPRGVAYQGADLVKRAPETHLIEINEGHWPNLRVDAVVGLGVLEYVYDPEAFVRGLLQLAPMAVFTYHVGNEPGKSESQTMRRKLGWLNDFDMPGLVTAIDAAGGRLVRLHSGAQKEHFTQYFFKIYTESSDSRNLTG